MTSTALKPDSPASSETLPAPGAPQLAAVPKGAAAVAEFREAMWEGPEDVTALQRSAVFAGTDNERTSAVTMLGTELLKARRELEAMRLERDSLRMQLCMSALNEAKRESPPLTYEFMEKWLIDNKCQQVPHFVKIFNRAESFRALILPGKGADQNLVARAHKLQSLVDELKRDSTDLKANFWEAQKIFGEVAHQMDVILKEDQFRKTAVDRVFKERMDAKETVESAFVSLSRLLQILIIVQGFSEEVAKGLPKATEEQIQGYLQRLREMKNDHALLAADLTALCNKTSVDQPIQSQAREWQKQLAGSFNHTYFQLRLKGWDLVIQMILGSSSPYFREVYLGLLHLNREASVWKGLNRDVFNADTLTMQLKGPDNANSFANRFTALKQQWWGMSTIDRNREQADLLQKIQQMKIDATGDKPEVLIASSDQRESVLEMITLFAQQRKDELTGLKDVHAFGANVGTELNRLDGMIINQATPKKTTQILVEKFAPKMVAAWAGYSTLFDWSDPSQTPKVSDASKASSPPPPAPASDEKRQPSTPPPVTSGT